jgi:hypothetical protein
MQPKTKVASLDNQMDIMKSSMVYPFKDLIARSTRYESVSSTTPKTIKGTTITPIRRNGTSIQNPQRKINSAAGDSRKTSNITYPFKQIVDAVWLTTVIVVAFKKVRVLASDSWPIAAPFNITCTIGKSFCLGLRRT